MMNDKKLAKIEKILGEDVVEELSHCDKEELKGCVAYSAGVIKTAEEDLAANPKYQELKEQLKAISEGLREVKKYQNAKIQFSLHLLEERKNES